MDPRMGPFDAVMFDVEADPVLRSFITVIVELDTEPDPDRLAYRIDRLTRLMPKLRQRVIGNSVSLVPPRWENDPNFDFDFHYRTESLSVGTMDDLLDHASTWSEQDFDRSRPLWEVKLFTGLEGGRAALGLKIHHSITDGVGGMQLAAAIFDFSPEAEDPQDFPDVDEAHAAGWRQRLQEGTIFEASSLVSDVKNASKFALDAGKSAVTDPMGSLMTTQEFLASASRLLAPANEPLSPLMSKRSLSQWFAELSVDLSDLKAAGKACGGTLNDAFVAGVVGALRKYHAHYGEVPDELRIHMPINRRSEKDTATGNAWIPARFTVPTNEDNPAQRIRQLHPVLSQAKEEPALVVSDQVYKVLMTLPRGITTRIAGGLMKGTDFVATNVPGPPIPVFVAGSRVTRMLPFAPKGGAAVNVALMSYNGRAELAINIDRQAVTDPGFLRECFVESFAEVVNEEA